MSLVVKRVLHVTPSFHPATAYGGPVEMARIITEAQALRGMTVSVITTDANGPRNRLRVSRRHVTQSGVRVSYHRRWFGESIAPGLLAEIWRMARSADVIHLHGAYSFPTIPALLLARVFGKPVVWSPHGAFMTHANSTGRVLFKRVWVSFCRVIAPPRTILHAAGANELSESTMVFPRMRKLVVPLAVEVPQIPLERTPQHLHILFVGRLTPIKGIENLIQAFRIIAQSRSGSVARLTIAGSGDSDYERELRTLAQRLELTTKVSFVGAVSPEERNRLLQSAMCLVLPSHSENFGMAVAEALAQGVPVVASTGTPWKDLDLRGCGKWVSNDPSALADAILALATEDLARASECARRWAADDFSVDAVVQQLSLAYERACSD